MAGVNPREIELLPPDEHLSPTDFWGIVQDYAIRALERRHFFELLGDRHLPLDGVEVQVPYRSPSDIYDFDKVGEAVADAIFKAARQQVPGFSEEAAAPIGGGWPVPRRKLGPKEKPIAWSPRGFLIDGQEYPRGGGDDAGWTYVVESRESAKYVWTFPEYSYFGPDPTFRGKKAMIQISQGQDSLQAPEAGRILHVNLVIGTDAAQPEGRLPRGLMSRALVQLATEKGLSRSYTEDGERDVGYSIIEGIVANKDTREALEAAGVFGGGPTPSVDVTEAIAGTQLDKMRRSTARQLGYRIVRHEWNAREGQLRSHLVKEVD